MKLVRLDARLPHCGCAMPVSPRKAGIGRASPEVGSVPNCRRLTRRAAELMPGGSDCSRLFRAARCPANECCKRPGHSQRDRNGDQDPTCEFLLVQSIVGAKSCRRGEIEAADGAELGNKIGPDKTCGRATAFAASSHPRASRPARAGSRI